MSLVGKPNLQGQLPGMQSKRRKKEMRERRPEVHTRGLGAGRW
jgi:hypothetical protein